tara:strand:- start:780 stop:1220 length:441 start_codon:yes stop_codon:yes gene_type:complete
METGILNALLEYGSMGLFAAFLVWQHLNMQKRFDKLVEKFQTQLEGIQEKSELNEEKLRERYDAVIKQYQEDKNTFSAEAIRKLELITKEVESLPFDSILIQIEAVSMAQRTLQISLEKGMEIIKDMQEEHRIREMARKLSDNKDT